VIDGIVPGLTGIDVSPCQSSLGMNG
jgi:hypothetical protein